MQERRKMKLAYKKLGQGSPLIILHGLYGSSDNWVSIARRLAEYFEVYVLDMRNHGQSPHAQDMTYKAMRNDLEEFMNTHNIGKAILLGHSMGGKTAMFFAVQNPGRINRLIIVDISPRTYTEGGFSPQIEKHFNLIHAMLSVDFSMVNTRADVAAQLAENISEMRLRQFLLKNLTKTDEGYKWKINIWAISNNLKEIMKGIDKVDFSKPVSNFPVLFIKGGKSAYISDIDIELINRYFDAPKIVTIQNAGHWLHAEKPEEFIKSILGFILH